MQPSVSVASGVQKSKEAWTKFKASEAKTTEKAAKKAAAKKPTYSRYRSVIDAIIALGSTADKKAITEKADELYLKETGASKGSDSMKSKYTGRVLDVVNCLTDAEMVKTLSEIVSK